jgi:hypothetical protein
MKPGNVEILDYYLFPRAEINKQFWRMKAQNGPSADAFRTTTLQPLYAVIERGNSEDTRLGERIKRIIAKCEQ